MRFANAPESAITFRTTMANDHGDDSPVGLTDPSNEPTGFRVKPFVQMRAASYTVACLIRFASPNPTPESAKREGVWLAAGLLGFAVSMIAVLAATALFCVESDTLTFPHTFFPHRMIIQSPTIPSIATNPTSVTASINALRVSLTLTSSGKHRREVLELETIALTF